MAPHQQLLSYYPSPPHRQLLKSAEVGHLLEALRCAEMHLLEALKSAQMGPFLELSNLRRWVFYTHLKRTRIKPTKHNKTPNTCTAAQQCEDDRLMNFSRWMVCNGLLTKKLRQQEMGLEGWDATDIGTS
jgi:hypothetical protein